MSALAHRARRPAATAPVLRERGQREVFCGLTGIIWLHRKIQDAFFLVVGSRTCAHLIQSAAGVMIFAEPRFATAIIEERDLAGLADTNEELDRVGRQLLERRPDIRLLFLVGSCPSEVIKLDLSRAALRLSRSHSPARADPQLFRQRHRDDLHPGRGCLPRLAGARAARRAHQRASGRCWSWARWPTWSRTSCAGCSTTLGIGPVHFLPPRRAADLPARRPRHLVPAGAALPGRNRPGAGGARRDAVCPPPSRSAPKAPPRWLRAAADAWGVDPAASHEVTVPRPRSARGTRSPATAPTLRASASSSSPTASSKSRWPASWRASWRCSWSRSARPTCTARIWRPELALLPPDTLLSEGQDVDRQLDRCRAARPDLIVCGLGLANPLEAEGIATKWSIELVFTPIQGYEQAADLAELFARPLAPQPQLVA